MRDDGGAWFQLPAFAVSETDDGEVARYNSSCNCWQAVAPTDLQVGNGIEDGGDVIVPLNTDVQGYSYSGSAAFDTRLEIGHSFAGDYRNGLYSYGLSGYGFESYARFNSDGTLHEDPRHRAIGASGYSEIVPHGFNVSTAFDDWRFEFDYSTPRIYFGAGASDYYEYFQDERPTENSVQVTTSAGATTWEAYPGTIVKIMTADSSNNSSTVYTDLLSFPVTSGRTYSGTVKIYWEPVAAESIQVRLNPASGTISSDMVDIRDTTPEPTTNSNPMTVPDYASTGKSSTTLDFAFTASATTTVTFQFRKAATGAGFSHDVLAGTKLTVDSIQN